MVQAVIQLISVELYGGFRLLLLLIGYAPLVLYMVREQLNWFILGYTAFLMGSMLVVNEPLGQDPASIGPYIFISVFLASTFFFLSAYSNWTTLREIERQLQETGEVDLG